MSRIEKIFVKGRKNVKKWVKKYLQEVSLLLIAGLIQILVAVIINLITG